MPDRHPSALPTSNDGNQNVGVHGDERPGRQRQLYDELWRDARAHALSTDLVRFRLWAPHLRPPVVDVGAGDALLMRSFPSLDVISLDLSDVGLRQARGRSCAAAAEHLPLRDQSAMTVVMSEVLEHVTDPDGVLGECRRIVAPGGRLLLSVPLWPIARATYALFWRRMGQRPTLDNISEWDPEHERRFDLDDLLGRVTAAGFVVAENVPLFGSASSAAYYVAEPRLARLMKRPVRLAHRLTGVDRLLRGVDRSSAAALICVPDDGRGRHGPAAAGPAGKGRR